MIAAVQIESLTQSGERVNRSWTPGAMAWAVGMIVGVALGAALPVWWAWLGAAVVCAGVMAGWVIKRGHGRAVICWGWLAFMAISGAWMVVREHRAPPNSIERYLAEEPALQRVQAVVEGQIKIATPRRGPFGAFSYEKPDTFFMLRLERLAVPDQAGNSAAPNASRGLRSGLRWVDVSGRLLGKIQEADPYLRPGMRIDATGWSARIRGPVNPGEYDFARAMRRRGVDGRLTMTSRGNWHELGEADVSRRSAVAQIRQVPLWLGDRLGRLRARFAGAAGASLAIGWKDRPELLGLLNRVVLGRYSQDISDLEGEFRRVGLAHLLAISGAHLGVLLGLAWLAARLMGVSPGRASLVVLVLLGMYLLAVPVRVPVARASIMALLLLGGYATGRGRGAEDRLAAAAMIVLLWRPGDLFDAGFQLSFLTVWALIRFTPTVSGWLMPRPALGGAEHGLTRLGRHIVDALAVSVVAFCAAAPVVAYHFQMVSPLAAVLSFIALPVFILLLGVGYMKALVGIALPSVSWWLATPLLGLGKALAWLVRKADRLPGSSFELATRPSMLWVVGLLAVLAAGASGWFRGRRVAPIACLVLLTGWAAVEQNPGAVAYLQGREPPDIRLTTFSVGDGSCQVVQAGGQVLMFDCGSRNYPLIGKRSIVPGLRAIGVRHIDTLIISHGDLDHYAGVLDLAAEARISRVLVPPQLIEEGSRQPNGTTAFLLAELQRLGVPVETITRGWQSTRGSVHLEAHWPPPDLAVKRDNNSSVVLSFTAPKARLLLVGDIEAQAMQGLLASGDDLKADVLELPHHGSFVEDDSPAFLRAVDPQLVLQSAGARWAMHDRWQPWLEEQGARRLVTEVSGMIHIDLYRDGRIETRTFHDTP